jgi:hypothetical protein
MATPNATPMATHPPARFIPVPLVGHLYMLLWISPMVLWDLYRQRTFHRSYLIWAGLFVPASLAVYRLWGDPAWMSLAPRIVGVA